MKPGGRPLDGGVVIDIAREADAPAFLQLNEALDRETEFLLFEPGERPASLEAQRQAFAGDFAKARRLVFLARDGGEVVGFAGITAGAFSRNRHVASLVLGVRRSHWHRGIGRALLSRVIAAAPEKAIRRLELTVRTDNMRALHLYLAAGFTFEGVRAKSLRTAAGYHDEYYMGIDLPG